MKKTVLAMSVAALVGTSLFSCSSDDVLAEQKQRHLTEDEFVQSVSFVHTPLIAATARSKAVSDIEKPVQDTDITIISFKIARKSRDCKSGFGICDFKFFSKYSNVAELVESLDANEYLATVHYNQTNDSIYTDLLLDKPAPEVVYPLLVEEDLYWVKDQVTLDEMQQFVGDGYDVDSDGFLTNELCTLNADSIAFDASLGENGGYHIILKK